MIMIVMMIQSIIDSTINSNIYSIPLVPGQRGRQMLVGHIIDRNMNAPIRNACDI